MAIGGIKAFAGLQDVACCAGGRLDCLVKRAIRRRFVPFAFRAAAGRRQVFDLLHQPCIFLVDCQEPCGDLFEAALPRARPGCVADVDGLGFFPSSRQCAEAVPAVGSNPRFGLAGIVRAACDRREDISHEIGCNTAVVGHDRLKHFGQAVGSHKRPLYPYVVQQRRAVSVRQDSIGREPCIEQT